MEKGNLVIFLALFPSRELSLPTLLCNWLLLGD